MIEISHSVSRKLKVVAALALFGAGIALYLLYKHYADPTGTGICNLSDKVSCDVVNKSIYAEIFGIPVSGIGALGYLIMFLLALGVVRDWNFAKLLPGLSRAIAARLLFCITSLGFVFTLYLTYVEAFVLDAFCPFCVVQQVVILIMFVILMTVRPAIFSK